MPPLESLEHDFPIIDANFRHFCSSNGIFSVEDFLLHDIYVLVALAERHSSSDKLKQGITQILSIIDSQHQPWLNGAELLNEARQNKHVLSTGCQGIDVLLQGGLREGQLTELVGTSSSGKTQICQQAASNVAFKYVGSVMFLDTSNSFSPKRVSGFINQLLDPTRKQVRFETLERTLKKVYCHSVFDIFELLDVLHQLEFKLRSQVMSGDRKVRLLIIDSISSLITPILGGSGAQGIQSCTCTAVLYLSMIGRYIIYNKMIFRSYHVMNPLRLSILLKLCQSIFGRHFSNSLLTLNG